MVKILLINPYIKVDKRDYAGACAHPMLGLAYIAAFLEKEGYKPKILNCLALGLNNIQFEGSKVRIGLDDKDIKNCIRRSNSDIVGVTCSYTAHANEAHDIARLVKGLTLIFL